jgi:hypothetical protein
VVFESEVGVDVEGGLGGCVVETVGFAVGVGVGVAVVVCGGVEIVSESWWLF